MDEKDLENFLGAMKLDFHKHIMYPTNIFSECCACCSEGIESNEGEKNGASGYICKSCDLYVHKDCVEINNPYRHKHPLKLLKFSNDLHDIGEPCLLCGQEVKVKQLFYYCCLCDMTLCKLCPSKPLVVDHVPKKVHEHSLTQVMIKVSFSCDACGVCSDGLPCVCLRCCFIIHRNCITLPRVIHINRHDHRCSHSYCIGPGDWVCGVCRKGIDGLLGAYSCSSCRYAVHSKCATRDDVWDGVELEDVSEDENEDTDPFQVIREGVIKHFSHEHHLTSFIDGSYENRYCYACTLPIHFDPCYACTQCRFILHQTCANLPKKKRHEISNQQLTLCVSPKPGEDLDDSYFYCAACQRLCTGFYYEDDIKKIDVRCAQVSKTFNHGSHPHPLFSISTETMMCTNCENNSGSVMSCIECDFDLCFYCATLQTEVRHNYDRHPLSLCYGENKRGLYWCEICERETNPKEWFYTCNDCGSTLHVDCVIGCYLHVRPGHSFIAEGEEFEVVANDRPTRPFCSSCKERCVQPFVCMCLFGTRTLKLILSHSPTSCLRMQLTLCYECAIKRRKHKHPLYQNFSSLQVLHLQDLRQDDENLAERNRFWREDKTHLRFFICSRFIQMIFRLCLIL